MVFIARDLSALIDISIKPIKLRSRQRSILAQRDEYYFAASVCGSSPLLKAISQ